MNIWSFETSGTALCPTIFVCPATSLSEPENYQVLLWFPSAPMFGPDLKFGHYRVFPRLFNSLLNYLIVIRCFCVPGLVLWWEFKKANKYNPYLQTCFPDWYFRQLSSSKKKNSMFVDYSVRHSDLSLSPTLIPLFFTFSDLVRRIGIRPLGCWVGLFPLSLSVQITLRAVKSCLSLS